MFSLIPFSLSPASLLLPYSLAPLLPIEGTPGKREKGGGQNVPLFIILERLMNHGTEFDVTLLVRYPLANKTFSPF